MIDFYLTKDSGGTLYLDSVASVKTGFPERNFNLIKTLGEGSIISGIGNRNGREWFAEYNFKTEDEWDRYNYISYFNNNVYDDMYLYRKETQRFRCEVTAGTAEVIYRGSSNLFNSRLTTGMPIEGEGVPAGAVIESLSLSGSTMVLTMSTFASISITNHELQVQTFLGRAQVYASIDGGENYDNAAISGSIGLHLYSESPYFTSTTLANLVTLSATSAQEYSTTVQNLGNDTPAIYNLTLSTASSQVSIFQVKTQYGYGFQVQKAISPGDILQVDTRESDLKLYVNSVLSAGYFTAESQPFMILSGSNALYFTAGLSTAITVQIYERRL